MAMGSYGWNKSKFGTVQNVVGDYVVRDGAECGR